MSDKDVRVVIVGQDPYPQPGVATGLAFGVENGKPMQPSLQVIQAELALSYYNDITFHIEDTSLESWKNQGVLLLNASLTCEAFKPEPESHLFIKGSHSYLWRVCLMEDLFAYMDEIFNDVVFVFMGNKAQYYNKFITKKNMVLNVIHPVADYRTGVQKFIGSQIFNRIDENLKSKIKW